MARGILEHPFRPYDFRTDDNGVNLPGWEPGGFPRMVNPPLFHYTLALALKFLGDGEVRLRIAYAVYPLLAALALYLLAARLVAHPLAAALLAVLSPVFWLSSYSLLIDMAMLAFILWGTELFLRGWEEDRRTALALGSLLLALAPLTKYTAYPYLALAPAWAWSAGPASRRKATRLLWLLIPVALTAAWELWMRRAYGESHILACWRRGMSGSMLPKLVVGLSFLSGASLFAHAGVFLAYRNEKDILGIFYLVLQACALLFATSIGGFTIGQALLLSLNIAGSCALVALIARRSRELDRVALAWFAASFVLTLLPIAWLAGRYFLAVLPPLAILTVRLIEIDYPEPRVFVRVATVVVVLTGACSAFLAAADYLEAETYRAIAEDVELLPGVRDATGRKIVLGDPFFAYGYYLSQRGWAIEYDEAKVRPGDILVKALHSAPTAWRPRWNLPTTEIGRIAYRSWVPFRLMDIRARAGFYGSLAGALPFSVSNEPLEEYVVSRVE